MPFPCCQVPPKALRVFHQRQPAQAIAKAQEERSYVVTTGTGSGKSLAFFIPMVDRILKARASDLTPRTRAIVIYPMNTLANSQMHDIIEETLERVTDPTIRLTTIQPQLSQCIQTGFFSWPGHHPTRRSHPLPSSSINSSAAPEKSLLRWRRKAAAISPWDAQRYAPGRRKEGVMLYAAHFCRECGQEYPRCGRTHPAGPGGSPRARSMMPLPRIQKCVSVFWRRERRIKCIRGGWSICRTTGWMYPVPRRESNRAIRKPCPLPLCPRTSGTTPRRTERLLRDALWPPWQPHRQPPE